MSARESPTPTAGPAQQQPSSGMLRRAGSAPLDESVDRARSRSRGRGSVAGRGGAHDWSHIKLSQKYAYRSLDKVEGTVEHASFPEADRIKIHLVGSCYITEARFVNGTYRDIEREWEFLRLTKRYELDDEIEGQDLGGGSRPVLTKFWFRLPESLLETACPLQNPFHLLLPPTVGCEREDGLDDMSPRHPTPAQIEYVIQAELYHGRELLRRFRQPFRVAPRHFTVPGTMNPPPEYDSEVRVDGEVTRAVGGKIGKFEIALPRPPALLTSLESHQQTTRVPITLEFHSTTSRPPKISAVNLKLVAITSARSEHILEGMGEQQAKRAIECRLNRCEFSKANTPNWLPARPGVYTTEIDLPVTVCGTGYVAIPEFESCLVDRTYRLALKFELVPATGLPLNACRLKFPVWIMADEFYGIPSETPDGIPVKLRKRYAPPDEYLQNRDTEEPAGSLPKYEDTIAAAINDRFGELGLGGPAVPTAHFPSTADGLEAADGNELAARQVQQLAAARFRGPPTVQAPFRYRGQEPDYWESQHHRLAVAGQTAPCNAWRAYEGSSSRPPRPAAAAATSSRPTTTTQPQPQPLEGVEPLASPSDADDPDREPAWVRKERERAAEEALRRERGGVLPSASAVLARGRPPASRFATNSTPEPSHPASPELQPVALPVPVPMPMPMPPREGGEQ